MIFKFSSVSLLLRAVLLWTAVASLRLGRTHGTVEDKKYNVVLLLLDDVSTESFPEYGNPALKGKLRGWQQLKDDGAVYYSHFFSPSSMCAPSQVGLFSGKEPGDIGGQYQFAGDAVDGKKDYFVVTPPEIEFIPEMLRAMGYYAAAGGKLDYQVGNLMPTFYNKILGNAYSDITSYQNGIWDPAISKGRPFFGMLNAMDIHQLESTMYFENPIRVTDGKGGIPNLPFKHFGYATSKSLLFPTGENGTAQWQPVVGTNLTEVDIIGYGGDFDEDSISHENGGVPGYLPDDIGIRSILSREYDLIRNVDYRIEVMIDALKKRGVYDDTLIIIFGDHGSALYKAKYLMQPQSLRTPMWIKYPADMPRPSSLEKHEDGYLIDNRMSGIIDIYPTILSVLGVRPKSWMTGVALAGDYAVTETRDTMFGILQRSLDQPNHKTFVAFNKKHFYQRNLVTTEILNEYGETIDEDERDAYMARIEDDSIYEVKFGIWPASPIYDRLRRLILQNAADPEFLKNYAFLAADGQRAPSEVYYDLEEDRYGTKNLIIEYTYNVHRGSPSPHWGSNVEAVTVEYGAVDESGLSPGQSKALHKLRSELDAWIDGQTWATPTMDFSEFGFAEENAMAEAFWPGGVQPVTANVEVSVAADPSRFRIGTATLNSPTPGTINRYSVNTPEEEEKCEYLGSDVRESIPFMSMTKSGLSLTPYTSFHNRRNYTGYRYGVGTAYPVEFENFVGGRNDCVVFVSANATFLEVACPGMSSFVFDTRDSTWNGTHWVGVDPQSGEWTGDPVSLWNEVTHTLNYQAFSPYVFGPERDLIYSGLNSDGTPFIPTAAYQIPLRMGFNPAPKYWGTNIPVNRYVTGASGFTVGGWNLDPYSSYFLAVDMPRGIMKGSFQYVVYSRMIVPARYTSATFAFQSFDYECLFWEVGKEASLDFTDSEENIIFTQGVRKGYQDSGFVRAAALASDVENMCVGVKSFQLWDAKKGVLIGPLVGEIDLSSFKGPYASARARERASAGARVHDAVFTIEAITACTHLKVTLTLEDSYGVQLFQDTLSNPPYVMDISLLRQGKYTVTAVPSSGSPISSSFVVIGKKGADGSDSSDDSDNSEEL